MQRTVFRLGPRDVSRMRNLNGLFAREFGDPQSYAGAPPDDGYVEDVLAKDHVIVLVCEEEREVLGGLVAYEFDKLEQARREIYIYDLAVAAGHRRRGIATALIGRVCAIARERGAWAVFVQADHGDDPAVALYTKLGTREDVMHFDIRLAGDVPATRRW